MLQYRRRIAHPIGQPAAAQSMWLAVQRQQLLVRRYNKQRDSGEQLAKCLITASHGNLQYKPRRPICIAQSDGAASDVQCLCQRFNACHQQQQQQTLTLVTGAIVIIS